MMSRDGQYREARCFTEEGVYILSILAQTPNAREFRSRVAAMLRELRSSRFQINFPLPPNPPGVRLCRRPGSRAARRAGGGTEAAKAMLALHPKRRETLKKALRYAKMGLSCREITKLLDGN